MKTLLIFLLGFSFTYVINGIELLFQYIQKKLELKTTRVNAEIDEWKPNSSSSQYDIVYTYGEDGFDDDLFL